MIRKDISGMRFGKLTAIELDKSNTTKFTKWLCKCDCGKISSAHLSNLSQGKTKSCGCQQTESRIKHSMHGTKPYRVWGAMIQRCTNPNATHFDRYGGRGILVSDEWKDFSVFYADMGNPPNGMTIERIDNSKSYSKENCKWATRKEQTRNRDATVLIYFNGLSMTLDEWASKLEIPRERLRGRIRRGWTLDRVFSWEKIKGAAK